MKKKTLLPYKQALLYGTAVSLLLFGCGTKGNAPESFERSEYYTRGIGQYPGSPAEDFSPNLKPLGIGAGLNRTRNASARIAQAAQLGFFEHKSPLPPQIAVRNRRES